MRTSLHSQPHHPAALLLGALLTGFLSVGSSAASSAQWTDLAEEANAWELRVRSARIAADPREVLEAEEGLAQVLERASRELTAVAPESLPGHTASLALLRQLLLARDPLARKWLKANWARAGQRLDPAGTLNFWAGMEAYEAQDWTAAIACLEAPLPPWLRPYAEWLRVRALERVDRARAGEAALHLVQRASRHPFRERLALIAARALIEEGDLDAAERFLSRWLDGYAPDGELQGSFLTLEAEVVRRRGDRTALRERFARVTLAGKETQSVDDLRLAQARDICKNSKHLPANQLADCIRVISTLGSAREGYRLWRQSGSRMTGEAWATATDALLSALYRDRESVHLLELAGALERQKPRRLRMRAALMAARVWRRRGDLDALADAYHRAALWSDTTASLSSAEETIVATALWELGRELEDAERWADAVQIFERLQRHGEQEQAREASLRAALCAYRAGRVEDARARLVMLCQDNPRDRIAGPCLWCGLLSGSPEREEHFARAAREENPGYFAHRAAAAADLSDLFWERLSEEIRDPQSWDWPASRGSSNPGKSAGEAERVSAARILRLMDTNPNIEAGQLFLSHGYLRWARSLWRRLPGWRQLSPTERAALLRALGDQGAAVRSGLRAGEPRERYPLPFAAELSAVARRFGFSPAFLLAVMRQESLFEPAARSAAGARGLMQLMPATARRMADSLGMPDYDLERPQDNIRLGARHLDELLSQTDGSVVMALAAYNAGLENARRWYRPGMPWDDYIERIAFAETRHFVKSVLMHYWFYRSIYPPPAAPRPSD